MDSGSRTRSGEPSEAKEQDDSEARDRRAMQRLAESAGFKTIEEKQAFDREHNVFNYPKAK